MNPLINQWISNEKETLLYFGKANIEGSKGEKNIVLTDLSISVFPLNISESNAMPEETHLYFALSQIAISQSFQFALYFNEVPFRFTPAQDGPQVKSVLSNQIYKVFPKNIVSSPNFSDLEANGVSIDPYLRFCSQLKLNKIRLSSLAYEYVTAFIANHPKFMDTAEVPDITPEFPYIIDLISVMPIKKLIIGNDHTKSANIIIEYLNKNKTLEEIEFKNDLNPYFGDILKSIFTNPATKINTLHFSDMDLNKEAAADLDIFLQNFDRLALLGFHRAFKSFPASEFLSRLTMVSVHRISFDGSTGIDIFSLVKPLAFIVGISFNDCELSVNSVLTAFASLEESGVKSLAVRNSDFLDTAIDLPKSVERYDFTGVTFHGHSLSRFLDLFFDPSIQITRTSDRGLLLNGIGCKKWNEALDHLQQYSQNRFTRLGWEKNPIDLRFFKFISNCADLTYLSLSNCFTGRECYLNEMARYFYSQPSINKLVFQNNPVNVELINSLFYCTMLESVNFSGCKMTNEQIVALGEAFKAHSQIKELIIVGNGVKDSKTWKEFYQMMKKRKGPITVHGVAHPKIRELAKIHNDRRFTALYMDAIKAKGEIKLPLETGNLTAIPEDTSSSSPSPPKKTEPLVVETQPTMVETRPPVVEKQKKKHTGQQTLEFQKGDFDDSDSEDEQDSEREPFGCTRIDWDFPLPTLTEPKQKKFKEVMRRLNNQNLLLTVSHRYGPPQ